MPVASPCRRCTIQLPTSFIPREVARSVMSWWMANGVCAVAHSYVERKQRWHGLTADAPNLPWAADHERAIATRMRAAVCRGEHGGWSRGDLFGYGERCRQSA